MRFLAAQWSERDGDRRRAIPGIFGIFGHGNVCGLGPALEEDEGRSLSFHQPKNEQSMVHAAIGYARANKLLSTLACSASIGPGSTNLLTGAATATVNRVPVLLLPSDTFANRRQGPVMQALEHPLEADLTVNDAFRPLSAYFDRITRPEQLVTSLPEAMRVLLDPAETGAVTLSLHQDVQAEAYDFPPDAVRAAHVACRAQASGGLRAARRGVEAIRDSERPLVIAGGGVHYSDAQAELAELSARFGIPVAETSAGKGALPSGDLAMGGVGVTGTRAANALAREADLVICVGTRLIDLTTGSHSLFQDPGVRFVGLNLVARDAHKLGALPLVADAKLGLRALAGRARERGLARAPGMARTRARGTGSLGARAERRPRPARWRAHEPGTARFECSTRRRARTTGSWSASGTPHVDVHKLWDASAGAALPDGGRLLLHGGRDPCGARRPDGAYRTPARCTC